MRSPRASHSQTLSTVQEERDDVNQDREQGQHQQHDHDHVCEEDFWTLDDIAESKKFRMVRLVP
jgi:hypothetical protein